MIKLKRNDAIEQLILSLGALPMPDNWNASAIAEKLVNELEALTENQTKRKMLGVKNS